MDDALGVRGVECVGDLDGKVEQPVRLKRLARDAMLEGLSFEQFHSDEGLAFVLINVVDRADVGMVERGRRLGLTLESLQGLPVLREFFRQELQGDGALELGVLGLIDHTHAPAAQLLQDAIVGYALANHGDGPAFGGYLRLRLQLSQRCRSIGVKPR